MCLHMVYSFTNLELYKRKNQGSKIMLRQILAVLHLIRCSKTPHFLRRVLRGIPRSQVMFKIGDILLVFTSTTGSIKYALTRFLWNEDDVDINITPIFI